MWAVGWKTIDKRDGLLPFFLSGGFEILRSANKHLGGLRRDVWLIALCVCGLGRTFARRTGKRWKR